MDSLWPLPGECRQLLDGMFWDLESPSDRVANSSPSCPKIKYTSNDVPWPLPVRHYERSYAVVVSTKSTLDPLGNFKFFAYSIRFSVVDIGTDPNQNLASDFALITAEDLDAEVAQMSVNLFLPSQACVVANTKACGTIALTADQLDLTKRFNAWLFNVVLGKPPFPAGSTPKYIDSPKGYYILPLMDNSEHVVDFDWTVVESALISGMIYRKKVKFFGGFAKLEAADIDCDVTDLKPGQLILRNGRFSEGDLDDAMITCAHNGMPCYVTAISEHLNGWSCFPSSDNIRSQSYADYYASKCEYQLRFKDQPFLKGCRLLRASNYLKRQEPDAAKGKDLPKTNERLELPPEICSLHLGIKGRLCRGAMRLPSVLYSLEMALLAAELRDRIGLPISCFKVIEALTSRACQGDVSYEALELLGDSILKFTGCTYLFLKDFLQTQDQLGATLYELVRNKTLFYCAVVRDLARYVFVEPFAPSLWIPPGLIRCEMNQTCMLKDKKQRFLLVSCRTLADIVEALIGAYLMNSGLDVALKAMAWLSVPIKFPPKLPQAIISNLFAEASSLDLYKLIDVDRLERKLGYVFKNKYLLAGALNYDSQKSTCSLLFQRLEFLGDGIFDFVITRHLVGTYQELDEGKLSELKQAIRNNENLAAVAVRHGLHPYLWQVSPSLKKSIAEFVSSYISEGGKAFGLSNVCAPRALGDLLQTIASVVFLDSGFDIELVWKIVRPLLEPLATPLTVTLHPIKQLETLCLQRGWNLSIHVNCTEGFVQAQVIINELVMGNSQSEDKKVARRLAATMALRLISHPTTNLDLAGDKSRCQL
ncbi:hypothetical protein Mapa_003526 [Marchantia paleacea]|nr:hypothetical protein Mapa_003526 [Marchantia paleacea]